MDDVSLLFFKMNPFFDKLKFSILVQAIVDIMAWVYTTGKIYI